MDLRTTLWVVRDIMLLIAFTYFENENSIFKLSEITYLIYMELLRLSATLTVTNSYAPNKQVPG